MSVFDDVANLQKDVRRKPGESDEHLAHRLFNLQMEVYSANAGSTLYDPILSFPALKKEDPGTYEDWIEKAKNLGKEPIAPQI
jgi:hypothetical protein